MQFVLGVFANDSDRSLVYLKEEQDAIENALMPLLRDEELVFYSKNGLTFNDLIHWITQMRDNLNWFHFSGHYIENEGISLSNGNFQALTNNLRNCPNLKGVFINGCCSIEMINELSNHVPICIGTTQPVGDWFSSNFSLKFYSQLWQAESWTNFNTIIESFNTARANSLDEIINNIRKQENLDNLEANIGLNPDVNDLIIDIHRGAGNSKELGDSIYVVRHNENLFNARANIENLNFSNNTFLRNLLFELSENNDPVGYNSEMFYSLSNYVTALDVTGEKQVYRENRYFSANRFQIIRRFFYSYLDICRYSILSALWDEIIRGDLDQHNYIENVNLSQILMSYGGLNNNHIESLEKLAIQIIEKHGKKEEKAFFKLIMPSFDLLKHGVEFYAQNIYEQNGNKERDWLSELILHRLLKRTKFLNNYEITSIHSRYYLRYRAKDSHSYRYKFIRTNSKDYHRNENNDDEIIYPNNYSVYITNKVKDKEEPQCIINLSPFYFDNNSVNNKAKKIDLYVLDRYDVMNNMFYFKNLFNPTIDGTYDTNYGDEPVIIERLDDIVRSEKITIEETVQPLFDFVNM